MVTFDVALPRNYAKWYEFLPKDLLDQCAAPYRGSRYNAMCSLGLLEGGGGSAGRQGAHDVVASGR